MNWSALTLSIRSSGPLLRQSSIRTFDRFPVVHRPIAVGHPGEADHAIEDPAGFDLVGTTTTTRALRRPTQQRVRPSVRRILD